MSTGSRSTYQDLDASLSCEYSEINLSVGFLILNELCLSEKYKGG